MTHTIDFLKKAREVGATHTDARGNLIKENHTSRSIELYLHYLGKWTDVGDIFDITITSGLVKIDFTPLDDYHADKELDINATGFSE